MSIVTEKGDVLDTDNNPANGEPDVDSVDPDPHFEPVVTLPEVEVSTNEENEIELIKLRAKLFRFDNNESEISQWKERGTGEVKILRHKDNNTCRIVMRRDKTFKICANHFITPWMSLKPSCGSDRAWVWTTAADFADETAKSECLAIRFANADIANQWKVKFEEAQKIVIEKIDIYRKSDSTNDLNNSSGSDQTVPKSQSETVKNEEEKENLETNKLVEKLEDLNVSK